MTPSLDDLFGETNDNADGKPVIVLVDDNELVHQSLGVILKARYEIEHYYSLTQLKTDPPKHLQVVLLDVKMSGGNGVEVFNTTATF